MEVPEIERNPVTSNSPRAPRAPVVLAILVAALGLGVGAGGTAFALLDGRSPAAAPATVTEPETVGAAAAEGLSPAAIYDRTHDSVVEITTQAGQGSGFVYDEEGHVITNEHVVSDANSMQVRFASGATYPATLVGTDTSTDIAVIDVDAPASVLEPLRL